MRRRAPTTMCLAVPATRAPHFSVVTLLLLLLPPPHHTTTTTSGHRRLHNRPEPPRQFPERLPPLLIVSELVERRAAGAEHDGVARGGARPRGGDGGREGAGADDTGDAAGGLELGGYPRTCGAEGDHSADPPEGGGEALKAEPPAWACGGAEIALGCRCAHKHEAADGIVCRESEVEVTARCLVKGRCFSVRAPGGKRTGGACGAGGVADGPAPATPSLAFPPRSTHAG